MEFERNVVSRRNFGAEAQRREQLVGVVVLADFADRLQRDHVLVRLIRMNVMKRRRVQRISVRRREIHGDGEMDLGSKKQK